MPATCDACFPPGCYASTVSDAVGLVDDEAQTDSVRSRMDGALSALQYGIGIE